jgi:hypothetical protein
MDLKQKMIDMAREATGDQEITVAGDFQPKGLTWKRAAAAGAGSVLGDAIGGGDNWASTAGATGGYMVGSMAGTSGELPPVIVIAASPSKLYLFTSNNGKGMMLAKSLLLIDTLHRSHLTFELKQRVTTRTIVITDESTGHEYAMEGARLGFHHMNDLLDLLDDVDENEEARVAD